MLTELSYAARNFARAATETRRGFAAIGRAFLPPVSSVALTAVPLLVLGCAVAL